MADHTPAPTTCEDYDASFKTGKHTTCGKACLSRTVQTVQDNGEDSTYVCDVVLNRCECPSQLAIRLSGSDVLVYDVNTFEKNESINAGNLTALRFAPNSEHILWTCAAEGIIKTWDLRKSSSKSVQQWQDDSDGGLKPLLSFDVDKTANLVCAGSEQVREDSFLLFWDSRSTKLLGGYWESHTDDITQVTFNPTKGHLVASGSTDGLINIFDVQQSSEEDALMTTLNTDSSVASLKWLTKKETSDDLACITHTEDLQLWDTEEALQTTTWNRSAVQSKLKDEWCADYWTDVLSSSEVIAGNTQGEACLLRFSPVSLQAMCMLKGGHNGSVRCATWITKDEVLVTGGEDGQLCLWRCSDPKHTQLVTKMAALKTSRPHHKKPYLH